MTNLRTSKNGVQPTAGTRGAKDNSECASLRIGDLPKPEAVTTDLDPNKNACTDAAERQNGGNGLVITNSQEEALAETRKSMNKRALGIKK